MSWAPCPRPHNERSACPIAERPGGCFSDLDHVVPQRYRDMGWLVARYIKTPENKQQICRWEHEQKTLAETPALIPSQEFMVWAVAKAVSTGDLHLNRREARRLAALVENIYAQQEVDRGQVMVPAQSPNVGTEDYLPGL